LSKRELLQTYEFEVDAATAAAQAAGRRAVKSLDYDRVRKRIVVGYENGIIRQFDILRGKRTLELG
jgi:hypothetical protein